MKSKCTRSSMPSFSRVRTTVSILKITIAIRIRIRIKISDQTHVKTKGESYVDSLVYVVT